MPFDKYDHLVGNLSINWQCKLVNPPEMMMLMLKMMTMLMLMLMQKMMLLLKLMKMTTMS